MKTLAFAALFVGATGLLACGGGDDDVTLTPDAGDAPATCNPQTQMGCADGEKCTWLVVSAPADENDPTPFLARTDCTPDGSVAVGGACAEGMPGETTGYDDCAGGGLCIANVCRAICTVNPDSCPDEFACATYTNTFDDQSPPVYGVCDPTCDPVAQDCETEEEGCYLQLFDGIATCAPAGDPDLQQGDPCDHNEENQCFLNGCGKGFYGILFVAAGMPRNCAAYCTPANTYITDPDGDGVGEPNGGLAIGTAPYDCDSARIGAAADNECRFYQSYPADSESGFLDAVPPAYGFCTPQSGTEADSCVGDAADNGYSREFYLKELNRVITDVPENMQMEEFQNFCGMALWNCPIGCIDLETIDALDMAWCEGGPGMGTMLCDGGANRTLIKKWDRINFQLKVEREAQMSILDAK